MLSSTTRSDGSHSLQAPRRRNAPAFHDSSVGYSMNKDSNNHWHFVVPREYERKAPKLPPPLSR